MRSYPVQNLPRPALGQGGGFDCCTRPDGSKHCYQNCEERWIDQSTAVYPPCGSDGKPSACGAASAAPPPPPETPFGTPVTPPPGAPALGPIPPPATAPPAPGTAPWAGFHATPGGTDSVFACPLGNGSYGLLYADNPSQVAASGVDSAGLANFNSTPLDAGDPRCAIFAAQGATSPGAPASGLQPQPQPQQSSPAPSGGMPVSVPEQRKGGGPIATQPPPAVMDTCPLGPVPLAKWVESCPGFARSRARF